MKGLLTTAVGSYPKPPYLLKARSQFAKKELTKEQLRELELKATKEWIDFQDEIGLDILVDGEVYRGDMTTFFAKKLQGCGVSGLVRSYGNRYYQKPVVLGELKRREPMTVDMWQYAQSLTSKPVKGMVTGPYTMMDWSFNEYYPNRAATCLAFAEVVRDEVHDLAKAGAKYIQIDEPAISTRLDELDLAIEAMQVVTDGLDVYTISHMCYGEFNKIYPKILELPVNQLDLEMSNSNYGLLEKFKEYPFTKDIGFGVIDVHSHKIESVEQVKQSLKRALSVLPSEKIYIDPDCGLKTRTVEEAKEKLKVMVQAVAEVKNELNP